MKYFLICPVRNVSDDIRELAEKTVRLYETAGHTVHYPPRDTDQSDPVGLEICKANLKAIEEADVVLVISDGKSQGVLFDVGIAFALRKSVINIKLPEATEGKSFQNMLRAWNIAQFTTGDFTRPVGPRGQALDMVSRIRNIVTGDYFLSHHEAAAELDEHVKREVRAKLHTMIDSVTE